MAHGLLMGIGRGRGRVGPIWWGPASTVDDVEETGTATRSHEGHMVRVVGGVIGM